MIRTGAEPARVDQLALRRLHVAGVVDRAGQYRRLAAIPLPEIAEARVRLRRAQAAAGRLRATCGLRRSSPRRARCFRARSTRCRAARSNPACTTSAGYDGDVMIERASMTKAELARVAVGLSASVYFARLLARHERLIARARAGAATSRSCCLPSPAAADARDSPARAAAPRRSARTRSSRHPSAFFTGMLRDSTAASCPSARNQVARRAHADLVGTASTAARRSIRSGSSGRRGPARATRPRVAPP